MHIFRANVRSSTKEVHTFCRNRRLLSERKLADEEKPIIPGDCCPASETAGLRAASEQARGPGFCVNSGAFSDFFGDPAS